MRGRHICRVGHIQVRRPLKRTKAIVAATTYFDQPDVTARASEALGLPMRGIEIPSLTKEERLATRGW